MTIVPHALGGAAAATLTSNYLLAFLFGFLSHFILDRIPHLEPKFLVKQEEDGTKKWSIWLFVFVAAEFIITIIFFSFFKDRSDFISLLFGIFGGLFPDIVVNNPFLQKFRHKRLINYFFWFHDKIHLDIPGKYWYISLIGEVIVIGGSIWLLLAK